MSSSIAGIKAIIRPSVRTTIRNTLASVIQSMIRVQPDKEGQSDEKAPKRIQTQIHRRKKAKAVSPLTDEWESSQSGPPKGLKRPPQDMQNS